jgi:hypothetical protein
MKIGVAQADVELSGVLLREKTIVASLEIRTPLACSVTCTKTSVLTPRAMPEEHALCTRHQAIHPNPSMLRVLACRSFQLRLPTSQHSVVAW